MMKLTNSTNLGFSSAIALSTVFLTLACSSNSDTPPGQGGGSAQGGKSSNGGATANGGTPTSNGGATTSNGGASSGGASSGGASSGGASRGGSSSGGLNGGGVSNGGSANGGSADGGKSTSGGTNQGGGATGGAAAQGGGTAQAGAAAQGGSGGTSSGDCPSNASFCSGFEDSALPPKAVFKLNGDPATQWTASFEVDTSIKRSGKSSLRVKAASEAGGGGAYKMLAVPSGGSKFWVRMYMRSDKDLGDVKHNVFAQAAASDSPNDTPHMEFGEDVGMCWHFDDSNIRWPTDYGRINGTPKPYTLAKDTWHCVELFFDGEAHVHRAFVNGTELINATSFPSTTVSYTFFKFGYNSVNGTERKTWYDDVVVASERVPCQ